MAVIRNPFADRFVDDLQPLFEAGAMLGERLMPAGCLLWQKRARWRQRRDGARRCLRPPDAREANAGRDRREGGALLEREGRCRRHETRCALASAVRKRHDAEPCRTTAAAFEDYQIAIIERTRADPHEDLSQPGPRSSLDRSM